jgi:hypothetical protein
MARVTPTIPIVAVEHGAHEYWIHPDHWDRIEAVYAHRLSPKVWAEVLQVTNAFAMFAASEGSAQPMSAARARVASIRTAARELCEVIMPEIVSNSTKREAERYADALINQRFRHRAIPENDKLHGMAWLEPISKLPTAVDPI